MGGAFRSQVWLSSSSADQSRWSQSRRFFADELENKHQKWSCTELVHQNIVYTVLPIHSKPKENLVKQYDLHTWRPRNRRVQSADHEKKYGLRKPRFSNWRQCMPILRCIDNNLILCRRCAPSPANLKSLIQHSRPLLFTWNHIHAVSSPHSIARDRKKRLVQPCAKTGEKQTNTKSDVKTHIGIV